LYAVLPTLAARMWNMSQGDQEELDEMADYLQDMFWNFKLGDDMWLRIPRNFELGVMAAGVDRAIGRAMGNEKAFDGFLGSAIRGFLPIDHNSLELFATPLSAETEGIANYDFFRGRNIIPSSQNKLGLEYRVRYKDGKKVPAMQTSSRLAKELQEVSGIDARKIDFWMKRRFAWWGQAAGKLSNIGREDQHMGFGPMDAGVFIGSPAYNSKSVQEVMEIAAHHSAIGRKSYGIHRALISEYFDAPDRKGKDRLGKLLREYDAKLADIWRESPPLPGDEPSSDELALVEKYRKYLPVKKSSQDRSKKPSRKRRRRRTY